jgi:hypothetical protein
LIFPTKKPAFLGQTSLLNPFIFGSFQLQKLSFVSLIYYISRNIFYL